LEEGGCGMLEGTLSIFVWDIQGNNKAISPDKIEPGSVQCTSLLDINVI
jgi:hypothetical protein